MGTDPAKIECGQILLCIPNGLALIVLNGVLTGGGLSVTSTRNLRELRDAMRLGGHCAIVTVAELTGPIREISELPLVDIHSFAREWNRPGSLPCPELFDTDRFLRRVRVFAHKHNPLFAGVL
ncbi:hypothetical protein [Mesorhizobium sp. CN2-181]|uniref:hypothetical protein n=1 Tax=Mesorhizobium yinganensis TaxID=3157707 RepID=UPI0032B755CE